MEEDFSFVRPANPEPRGKFRVTGKKVNGEEVILYNGDDSDGQWFVFVAAMRGKKYLSLWMSFNCQEE